MTDYYKILGLTSNATLEDIKTAYRKLSKKFHPDLNQGDKFFEERFKEIQEAYEKLTNFEFKSSYDREKKNQENKYNSESQQYTKTDNTNNSQTKSSTNPSQPKPQPQAKSNNSLYIKIAVGLIIAILIGVLRGSIKKSALENAKDSYHNELNSSNNNSTFTVTDTTSVLTIPTASQDLNSFSQPDTAVLIASTIAGTKTSSSDFFANLSKEEIKNWLLKTLQENSQNRISCPERTAGMYSPCSHYNDYEFKVTDDYLIVNYNYNDEYDEMVYIPFYDYKSLYGMDYGSEFSISTTSNSMYEINKSTNSKSTTGYINIGFKNNAENKLITNIKDAFSSLKDFSSKPSTNVLPTFITNSDKNKPSLEETKSWFISKLKAYTSSHFKIKYSESSYIQAKNVSIGIDNFNLIIQCNTNQSNYKFIIPLCNANIKKPYDQYFNVDNINVCTLEFYTPIKVIEQYDNYSGKSFIKSVQLKVDLERENDLMQRLTKSLNILKSYCPKNSNDKETF